VSFDNAASSALLGDARHLGRGFMRDDVLAYREACAWLRDFADQKNIEQGRVMRGSNWSLIAFTWRAHP
jgi:hypothetical protein